MKEQARRSAFDLGEKTEEKLEGSVQVWDGCLVPSAPLMRLLSKERHFKFQKVIRVYLFIPHPAPERISGGQVVCKFCHIAWQGQEVQLSRALRWRIDGELGFPVVHAPQPLGCNLLFAGSLIQSSIQNEPVSKEKEEEGPFPCLVLTP